MADTDPHGGTGGSGGILGGCTRFTEGQWFLKGGKEATYVSKVRLHVCHLTFLLEVRLVQECAVYAVPLLLHKEQNILQVDSFHSWSHRKF